MSRLATSRKQRSTTHMVSPTREGYGPWTDDEFMRMHVFNYELAGRTVDPASVVVTRDVLWEPGVEHIWIEGEMEPL